MIQVEIADKQKQLRLSRKRLRQVVSHVLHAEGVDSAEVGIALVSDHAIQAINETYLRHVGPTDVITFPYSTPTDRPLSGEIALSTETALREAARRGHPPENEVLLYLVHGLLHLCGYDDHEPADRRVMRRQERKYLLGLEIDVKR